MENKSLYVLAGYDDHTEHYLANIQNKLYDNGFCGVHTKNIPQHITLGSFPLEKESELIELLENLSQTVKTFEVTFNHIGIFNGSKVLFVAPDCNTELLNLKENFGNSFGWTPHTTMLIDDPDVILNALPLVLKEFSSFHGKVTSLYLYEFWPARLIKTVCFK